MSELANALAATVGSLSSAHVGALAASYRSCGSFSAGFAAKVEKTVPAPHQDEVQLLNAAWSTQPELTGAGLAIALESAQAARRAAHVPAVEVVVTGPDSPAAAVRLTSEVVAQLIGGAKQRVTLVSFAAYKVPTVVAALDAAVSRGATVNLILESAENLNGGGGAGAYAKFPTYHWPLECRNPPDAKLHAKAVIVDNRDVLLTSANMTNAAYDKNIELGVLCRGGGVADKIQRHFDGLIATGLLELVVSGVAAQGGSW